MLEIIPLDTPSLGDRSYLVHDGQVALVIEPQSDIDRALTLAESLGVQVRHVFETHIHNDYVTGGRALADATGPAGPGPRRCARARPVPLRTPAGGGAAG